MTEEITERRNQAAAHVVVALGLLSESGRGLAGLAEQHAARADV